MTLEDLKKGEECRILSIDPGMEVEQKLLDMGFVPGTMIKMIRNAPLEDPIKFLVRGYLVSIRHSEAKRIEVTTV